MPTNILMQPITVNTPGVPAIAGLMERDLAGGPFLKVPGVLPFLPLFGAGVLAASCSSYHASSASPFGRLSTFLPYTCYVLCVSYGGVMGQLFLGIQTFISTFLSPIARLCKEKPP